MHWSLLDLMKIGIIKNGISIVILIRLDAIISEYYTFNVAKSYLSILQISLVAFRYILRERPKKIFVMIESSISIQMFICENSAIQSVSTEAQILTSIIPTNCNKNLTIKQQSKQFIYFLYHFYRQLTSIAFIIPLQQKRQMTRNMVWTMKPGSISNLTQFLEKELTLTDQLPFIAVQQTMMLYMNWLAFIKHQASTSRQIIIIFFPLLPKVLFLRNRTVVKQPIPIKTAVITIIIIVSPSLFASQQQNYFSINNNQYQIITHRKNRYSQYLRRYG